jgi:hypothetical protein
MSASHLTKAKQPGAGIAPSPAAANLQQLY